MNRSSLLSIFVAFLAFGVFLLAINDAYAARFGGGRSFGGKSSYSRSVSKPSVTQSANKKAATAAAAPSRGMFGGMGGMLGGLLAGSLLGSMLFGGGFGGGGGFLDILLIGLLVYFAFRFLKRKSAPRNESDGHAYATGSASPYAERAEQRVNEPLYRQSQAASGWDSLRSQGASSAAQDSAVNPAVPAGFDVDDFIKGARTVYNRMQDSWSRRDLDDIRQFTSDSVFTEISEQAKADPEPCATELLLVNARLLEVKEDGAEQTATVYFDVLMREGGISKQPEQVREVWHFMRQNSNDMWRLDGIQQLEQ